VTVVTDTSVVLNLCFLGLENFLPELFGKVVAPDEVFFEFERLVATDSRFSGLAFPVFIEKLDPSRLHKPSNAARLHGGEVAALSLAKEIRADFVLLDERAGRAAAREMGLRAIGLLGILIEAYRRSLLEDIESVLDRLQNDAGFWIAPSLRASISEAARKP
jgi:predicted nucleic acid-binding protein